MSILGYLRRRVVHISLSATMLMLGAPTLSIAQTEVESGSFKNYTLAPHLADSTFCTVLLDYMNKIPAELVSGPYYEIPSVPDLHVPFTRPAWEDVDLTNHLDVVGAVNILKGSYIETDNFSQNLANYLEKARGLARSDSEHLQASMSHAFFDLGNDGEKQEVFRYKLIQPEDKNSDLVSGWFYYVPAGRYPVNKDLNKALGPLFTEAIYRKSSTYDAVFYQEKTYLLRGPFNRVISVYLPEGMNSDGFGLSQIDKNTRDILQCEITASSMK